VGARGAQAPYPRNSIGGKGKEEEREERRKKKRKHEEGAPLVLELAPPLLFGGDVYEEQQVPS